VPQPISLEQLIRKKTFPKLVGLLLSVLITGAAVAFLMTQSSLQKNHHTSLKNFEANLHQRILSLRQEVYNLSANDLIINALIDHEVRDEYLPVFFRSLQLSAGPKASILFTDFAGTVISTNESDSYENLADKPAWQSRVLEDGEAYFEIRPDGIIIAYPVFYSEHPEGALLVYLPNTHKVLDSIRAGLPDELHYLLLDQNSTTLYSSDNERFPTNTVFAADQYPQWHHQTFSFQKYQLVSLQQSWAAYRNLIWLFSFALAALIVVFSGTFFSIRIATRTAAESIKSLQDSLSNSGGSLNQISTELDDVNEVADLKVSYNKLISALDLTSQSLSKFEGIIHSLNDYLVVTDRQFELLLSNSQFSKFSEQFGQHVEHSFLTLLPAQLLRANPESLSAERHYLLEDNAPPSRQTIEWVRTDYNSPEGERLGFVFVGNDLTETLAIRAELEIKNKAIEEAHTSVVISEYTKDMPITYVNKAFTDLTGYSESEAIGRNCKFLQGPRSQRTSILKIRESIDLVEPLTVTIINYRKDGSEFYNELSLSPIRNESGIVTHILGLQNDVTDSEKSKAFLAEAKARAEESASLKSGFLASMSHEIRTPMNGVLGMIHLLQNSALNDEQQHHASLAKTSADHLLTLLDDILDFSKIEAGKLDIEYVNFDLPSLFGDLVGSMSQRAAERNNTITLDMSQAMVRQVKCDPGRLRQIASNLIGNAIKFTENGDICIEVSIKPAGDNATTLCCAISDTGIGIPEDRLDSVFDTFTQADNSTTRKYGGTGLGLSICRQLCELMDGYIWASSEPGLGSRFCFEVKLEGSIDGIEVIQTPDLSAYQVIIADQNQANIRSLSRTLNAWGAQCKAILPKALSAQTLTTEPTILMVDVEPLSEEIKTALASIKSDTKNTTHVVAMTSLSHQYNTQQRFELGLALAFPKPATLDDLLQMADLCLNPNKQNTQPLIDENVSSAGSDQTLSSSHVLLVEDNPVNQLLAKTMLEQLGLEVRVANHGIEALSALKAANDKPFDAIFMDCQMPEMDGYEATACIRVGEGGDAVKDITIIAMTANAIKGDKEKCLDSGMDDYISKPIDVDELKRLVDRWLQNPPTTP